MTLCGVKQATQEWEEAVRGFREGERDGRDREEGGWSEGEEGEEEEIGGAEQKEEGETLYREGSVRYGGEVEGRDQWDPNRDGDRPHRHGRRRRARRSGALWTFCAVVAFLAGLATPVSSDIACPIPEGSFSPTVDYFPDKVYPMVSKQFSVHYQLSYIIVSSVPTSELYVLYLCNSPKPSTETVAAAWNTSVQAVDWMSVKWFQIPLQKVSVASRPIVGFFERLGLYTSISRVPSPNDITSPCILGLAALSPLDQWALLALPIPPSVTSGNTTSGGNGTAPGNGTVTISGTVVVNGTVVANGTLVVNATSTNGNTTSRNTSSPSTAGSGPIPLTYLPIYVDRNLSAFLSTLPRAFNKSTSLPITPATLTLLAQVLPNNVTAWLNVSATAPAYVDAIVQWGTLDVDAIFTDGSDVNAFPRFEPKMITLGTSGEAQPMARVEWLLFLSYFFNIAPAAQSLYTAVRNQYLCSTEYVLKNVTASGPKVLWVGRSGDQWLGKDGGWKGAVLADAGADVLLPGSSALKAVEVLVDETEVISDLAGVLASYGIANGTGGGYAFVGNKNVLRPDRIRNNFTSLDFPETSSARPDLLMADVIRVLYPFDSRYTTRYWLRNVALGDTQHVLYPNRICAHNASNPQPQAVAYTCGNSIAANYSYPPDFPTRASSTNSHPGTGASSAGTEKIVGGIIGGIAASGLLASGLWVWWRRRNGKDVVPNALRRWGIGGPRGLEAKGYPVYPPGPSSLELRETGWDNFREGSMRWSEWDDRSIVNGAGGNEGTLKVLGVVTLEGEVVKPWEDSVGLEAVKVDNRDGEKRKTEIDGPAPSPVSDILTVNAPRADQANGATESFRRSVATLQAVGDGGSGSTALPLPASPGQGEPGDMKEVDLADIRQITADGRPRRESTAVDRDMCTDPDTEAGHRRSRIRLSTVHEDGDSFADLVLGGHVIPIDALMAPGRLQGNRAGENLAEK